MLDTKQHPPSADTQTFGQEWWRGATLYQIYPRSFQDSNNDGIGDLPGITSRLPYVADLGVDGIWISPFFKSPMADFGYDVSDYCDVDPVFGTLSDFDNLISEAHRLNLKVIIDQVYCHTSDQHAWFAESRRGSDNDKSDWYVWVDPNPDGTPPNNWLSVFGGPAWTWDSRRQQYYLHHFLAKQPTLNLHNEDVVDALIAAGRFWQDRGVDGFRLDALNMGMHDLNLRNNPPFPGPHELTRPFDMQTHTYSLSHPDMDRVVQKLSKAFRDNGGEDFFTVAEIGGADPIHAMKTYTQGQERLSSAYSFDFIGASSAEPSHIRNTLSLWPNSLEQGYPSWAFSNHDTQRVATRWALEGAPNQTSEELFAILQAAFRGVVFIYQGEELGLTQAEIPFEKLVDPEAIANWPADQGRDGARTPMAWTPEAPYGGFTTTEPWLPVAEDHIRLNAQQQLEEADSTLGFFKKAILLRKSLPALKFGAAEYLSESGELVCFLRIFEGVTALCAVNLGATSADLPEFPQGNWEIKLSANLQNDYPLGDSMPAFSGLIAVLD